MRIKFLKLKDAQRYAVLQILVEGGGCSGFSYGFDVVSEEKVAQAETEMDGMLIFQRDGIKIVSDELTMEMINGSTIEYVEEMIRSAFEVTDNPMAEGGCSCGVSFSPKDV